MKYIDELPQIDPKYLDQPIESLQLSTRSYNCLRRAGIDTNRNRSCGNQNCNRGSESRDLIGCSFGKDYCDDRCIEMLTEILTGATVYIVTGYTDMRKGIDGLAQIVVGTV